MIHFKRLDHIQLCIPRGKEEEAKAFYCGILGLEEIPKPEALIPNGGFWCRIADIQLHIGVEEEVAASKRHPAFEVQDIQAAREYLLSCGVNIKEDIAIPGIRRFSLLDPFGNRIELLEKESL